MRPLEMGDVDPHRRVVLLHGFPSACACRENWVLGPGWDLVKLRAPSLPLGHAVPKGHHSTKSV